MTMQEDFGSRVVTGSDQLDNEVYRRSAGLPDWAYANMIAVLDHLARAGVRYGWELRGEDEAVLRLEDTPNVAPLRITLVPPHDKPNRVGSVMGDGIGYHLMTEVPDPEVAHRTMPPAQPTPVQTVNQVRAAMGQPLLDADGSPVRAPVTYTNNGLTRRDWIGDTGMTDASTGRPYRVFVSERATDHRRHREELAPDPDEAMDRLRTVSQSALDNAVEDMALDRVAATAARAVALGDGAAPAADGSEQELAAQVAQALDGAGDAGAPGSARRHAAVLRGVRAEALEPLLSDEPSVAVLSGRMLDVMEDAMGREENAGVLDPMEAEDADGASGYSTAGDGLDAMMAIDQGHPVKPDLIGHYASSASFGGGEISEHARDMALMTLMNSAGIDLDDLAADETSRPMSRPILNGMVRFDESDPWTPRAMPDGSADQVQAANQRRIMDRIRDDLDNAGVEVEDLAMDAQGIVRYRGARTVERRGQEERRPLEGVMGQIFVPDSRGVITTRFGNGDDFLLAPGYRASILPDEDGGSLLERTRLTGYLQQMDRAIDERIASDVHVAGATTGDATSLNYVTTHADGFRHATDFVESYRGEPGVAESILETEAGRVHYEPRLANTSGLMAAVRGQWEDDESLPRQTIADRGLTGGRNMSVIDDEQPGYFDPVMTTNGDTQQGLVRYLSADALVREDGSIRPAAEGGRTRVPIYYDVPGLAYSDFDTFDRTVMSSMNLVHSLGLSRPTGVEQATLGGWTMEDAVVVTARFARDNRVPGPDGEPRDLVAGDKISDFHGNKGVISKVVDTEDPQARGRAQEQGWGAMYDHVARAAAEGTDVFMAPFSAVSRFNGGSAREIMDDGGKARFIVSENTADHKTVTYGPDGSSASNKVGRSASAQLGWALQAHHADAVMEELYGGNMQGMREARGYLNVVGLDMDDTGRLLDHYEPGPGVEPVVPDGSPWDGTARPMKLPFGLVSPAGLRIEGHDAEEPIVMDTLPVLGADLRDRSELKDDRRIDYAFTNNYRTIYDNAARYSAIGDELAADDALKAHPDDPEAARAPLDDKERADLQARVDNAREKLKGDPAKRLRTYYTNLIAREGPVLEQGYRVREPLSESRRAELEEERAGCQAAAQAAYGEMADQVASTKLTGKHNVFKEGILSHEVDRSATAVWTPDPTLGLDDAAMSPDLMERLHLKEGDPFLAWRDPVLTTGGVHCFHAKADPELTGFAVNPVMAEYFDGDFDGDTLAIVGLRTEEAKKEAEEKLSLKANLTSPLKRDGRSGLYDLAINTGLDMQVGHESGDGSLMCEYQRLREDANVAAIWRTALDHGLKTADPDGFRAKLDEREQAIADAMGDHVHRTLDASFLKARTDFTDVPRHLLSVADNCLATGAKGSVGKWLNYARYLDADVDAATQAEVEKACGHRLAQPDWPTAETFTELRRRALDPDEDFTRDMNKAVKALHDFDGGRSYGADPEAAQARAGIERTLAAPGDPEGITDTAERRDGRAVRERDRQSDKAVNFATATKAFGTGVAGKVSQRAMILTRGSDVMGETLNLSSRATQGTLQIKHDAAKAVKVINSLTTGSRNVWSGRMVELKDDDATQSNWAPVRTGRPVGAEDWAASAYNYYTSPEGVDVAVDRESLERLSDFVSTPTRHGRVIDRAVFSPMSHLGSTPVAPIDLLAYGPDAQTRLDAVTALAQSGAGVYDRAGAPFAPRQVRKAIEAGRRDAKGPRQAGPPARTQDARKGVDPWAMLPAETAAAAPEPEP